MDLIRYCILGLLLLPALTPRAAAQQLVQFQADGGAGVFAMTPVFGDGPQARPFPSTMYAQGTVGGRSTATSSLGEIEIGFDYIRPFWTSRDFILAVPAANAASFPLLGNIGHVDNHFALAPHLNYKYNVSDILAIKATGSFMSLSGFLERNFSAVDGSIATLSANSSLTIVSANLPEISTTFEYAELFAGSHLYCPLFDEMLIDLGFGTRYSSVEQTYTGNVENTVAGGTNKTNRYSYQNFKGVGLTSSLNCTLPVADAWSMYTNLRGSVLVGTNRKDSTLGVAIVGQPGAMSSLSQNRTEFIPVAEIEIGWNWVHEFGDVATGRSALFNLRAGFSGQFWGNVAPLSAGSAQGYQTNHLFLAGAHVMIGLAH